MPSRSTSGFRAAALAAAIAASLAGCGSSGHPGPSSGHPGPSSGHPGPSSGQTSPSSGSGGISSGHPAARAASARLTVERATVGRPIPSGFTGLSMEFHGFATYAGTNPKAPNPVFEQLVRNIAPSQSPVLRIGGDGTDWSWVPLAHVAKPPGIRYDITNSYLQTVGSVARALHARVMLGVNLEADSTTVAKGEADAMVKQVGAKWIRALEIGNEPELYGTFSWYRTRGGAPVFGRPSGYDFDDYLQDFTRFAKLMPHVPIAGPSSGSPTYFQELGTFIDAEPEVGLVTLHRYPLKHCTKSTVVTMNELLSDSASDGLAAAIAPYVATVHAHHRPLRLDELNAITCGGLRGLSDSFGSALWTLESLFALARSGIDGVNIHTVPNTFHSVFTSEFSGGHWESSVYPQYYGMLMFAQAAPAGARLLQIAGSQATGTHVWGTRAPDGHIRVVFINDSQGHGDDVTLRVPAAQSAGVLERLQAPSVHSTSGVTLGGQSFGAETTTGVLTGQPATTVVTPKNGVYTVKLSPTSAAMLTLTAG
jgi:hypothetical protein